MLLYSIKENKMFEKLIGNIKKRVIHKKVDGAIDSIFGAYSIFGKHLEDVGATCTKNSFKHVVEAEKFDDMLKGAEMVLTGLQLVVQGAKTIDVKAIKRENKATAMASGMGVEMQEYSKEGFNGLEELLKLFKDNGQDFKIGDDVTDEVAKNPDGWREDTSIPDAVKSFNENLEKNMKDAS